MKRLKEELNENLAHTVGDVMKLILNLSIISYIFSLVLIYSKVGNFDPEDNISLKYLDSLFNSLLTITAVGYFNYYTLDQVYILLIIMVIVFSGFFLNGYMLQAMKKIFDDPRTESKFRRKEIQELEQWLMKRDMVGYQTKNYSSSINDIESFFRNFFKRDFRRVMNKWVMPTLKNDIKIIALKNLRKAFLRKFGIFYMLFDNKKQLQILESLE